jgi:hypothetical protein
MTETEWLACRDPVPLLNFLRGRLSERRLRLFACACARRVWHLLSDDRSRRAVEVAERHADGQAVDGELAAARRAALAAERTLGAARRQATLPTVVAAARDAAAAARAVTAESVPPDLAPWEGAAQASHAAVMALAASAKGVFAFSTARAAELAAHADLLRDIAGDPFHPLPRRDFPPLLIALARDCAADPGLFGVLADALTDLGEEGAAGHCRRRCHASRCHVLDWVQGRIGSQSGP